MAASKGRRNHYEFDVVIDGIALPEESANRINEAVQGAAAAAIASLDLRGKELVFSPIMARMISDPDGDGDGDGPAGGAQIAIRSMLPDTSGHSREGGVTPFVSHNVAVFRSKLASTKASGAEAIRISRVKDDLHLEQLGARGQTVVGFVLHPITSSAKEGKKVTAVEIRRIDSGEPAPSLGRQDRIALAGIVDELSQFKEFSASGVIYFWKDFAHAIVAGFHCAVAVVEEGMDPVEDTECVHAFGDLIFDSDDDDDE